MHILAAYEMMKVILEKREYKDIIIPDVICYVTLKAPEEA